MDRDRQPELPPQTAAPTRRSGLMLVVAAAVVLGVGFTVGRQFFGPVNGAQEEKKTEPAFGIPENLFRNWGQPELALLLSGQTFGYLQPCGCSEPQYGGLVRRYNLVKMLEKKGWDVVGVDLGEIYPPKADLHDQAKEKFKTTLRALGLTNYTDYGLGITEMKMPLVTGLAEALALQLKKPLPLSLDVKDPNNVFQALNVRSYNVIGTKAKVGISSLVGPSVAKEMAGDKDVVFFDTTPMIRALLPVLAKNKVDVVVLLVQGTDKEAEAIAKTCFDEKQNNPGWPNVDLIVYTSHLDTGPARPQLIQGTKTHLLFMGHKGKDVGVLGLFQKPTGGFELKYEFVQLGPQFATPPNQEKGHPLMDLMEDYSKTVKDRDFLEAYKGLRVDHPTQRDPILVQAGIQAKYVGTETCSNCHANAAAVWAKVDEKGRGHSLAFKSLVDAKHPSLRQYDPECVTCHTTGFKYRTGSYDPPPGANPKQIEKHNDKLLAVGCESCHGPGSMHANNPKNKDYYPLINPHRLKTPDGKDIPNAMEKLDRFCQSCHDIENDVHWNDAKFKKAWQAIAHPGKP